MNKEIETAKEDLSFMNEGDYITRSMSNSKDILEEYIKQLEKDKEKAYWKGYVQKQKEAEEICKMCKYRKKYKELEQKSNVLDKIKDFVTKISTENAEKYNSIKQKEVDFSEWNLADGILNIIEGEREYCCTCGVELNSENKALNNMCNECKYGLDYQKEREEK